MPLSALPGRWAVLNPTIYLVTLIPVALIGVLARNGWTWLFGSLGVLFLQHSVNVFNDVVDWGRGADSEKALSWVRFHRGETRLTRLHGLSFAVLGMGLGAAAVWLSGRWEVLAVSLVFVALGFGYNTWFSYHGWGEWVTPVCYGAIPPLLCLVSSTEWSLSVALVATATGSLAFAVLVAHQIPQIVTDTAAGKLSFAVRHGADKAHRAVARAWVLSRLSLVGLVMVEVGAAWALALALIAVGVRGARTPPALLHRAALLALVSIGVIP